MEKTILPSKGLFPSLIFAVCCAALLIPGLFGIDLPVYVWYILLIPPGLAVLRLVLAGRSRDIPSFKAYDLCAVSFVFMAFASLAYSADPNETEISLLWLSACIGTFLIARFIVTGDSLAFTKKILIWAACGTVLYNLWYFSSANYAGYPYIFLPFLNKNIYGGFLASVLPLIFLGEKKLPPAGYILRVLYGSIIVAGLMLTFSKGAWIAAVLALAVIAVIGLIQRVRLNLLAVGAAVLVGLALGTAIDRTANHSVISTRATPSQANVELVVQRSVTPRLDYWENSLTLAAQAPLLGHGYGTFADVHLSVARWPIYSKYAHNYLLQMLVELGAVGVLLFIGAIGFSLLALLKGLKRGDEEIMHRLPFYLGALVLLAHACIDFTLNVPEGAIWFWLLIGIGCPRPAGAAKLNWKNLAAGIVTIAVFASAGALAARQDRIDGLSQAVMSGSDPRAGIERLTQALEVRAKDADLLNWRASLYHSLGCLDQAAADLRAASSIAPYKPGYLIQLAQILVQLGEADEAHDIADEALAFNPTLPDIIEGHGIVLVAVGQRQEGVSEIARSVLLNGTANSSLSLQLLERLLKEFAGRPGGDGDSIRLALAVTDFDLGSYEASRAALDGVDSIADEDLPTKARLETALKAKGYPKAE